MVTHSFAKGSGQGLVNYEVVLGALREGHQVTLLSSEIASELKQHPGVTCVLLDVIKWPTELLRNIAFSMQSTRWLNRHRDAFDLIKVNGAITAAAADVNVAHFIHSAWLKSPAHTFRVRKDLYGLYQGLYTVVNAYWERQSFRRAEKVVAVSQKIAEELVTIGVEPARIEVIVNGVDLEGFSPARSSYSEQLQQRASLKLPVQGPLALFVGDIQTARKNLDTILSALVDVPDLQLAIAGRIQNSPYPAMAQQLGVATRVHFLDYRQDIPALMRASDFFVFPSRYEACTLVLLEAMASGLPVITALSSGGSELVTPECGIVLDDPNDVIALKTAMTTLTMALDTRECMGRAARQTAEKHSWESMAKEYVQLFEKVDASPPQRTA